MADSAAQLKNFRVASLLRMLLNFKFALALLTLLCACWSGQALSPDGEALLAFKNRVEDPRHVLNDWDDDDGAPCDWFGVTCNEERRVIALNVPRSRLSGSIAPELGQLSELRRLGLHFNNLTGIIPPQIVSCTLLRAMYLHHNLLSGAIPPTLGNLKNLKRLNLSDNLLSGPIPSNGSMVRFLADSFLGNANLCGAFPFLPCTYSPVSGDGPASGQRPSTSSLGGLKIAAIVVGCFLFVKFICGLYFVRKWSRRNEEHEVHLGSGGKLVIFQAGSTVPSSKEILRCIGKLRSKHVIGEGGYGVVYKLHLRDDTQLAVKKLKQCLESVRGFESELETLGTIKHRNLVRLRGFCTAENVKLLIYDFVPNGNLDQLLHVYSPELKHVPWASRLKIALGVARGLAYLHHGCNPRIIHRDVSASNVLLDEDLDPRLSDFGLAKLIGLYESHLSLTVGGTFGYVAPEYAQTGRATEKIDVYSYGVVLLELLTRRRPSDPGLPDRDMSLAGWVHQQEKYGQPSEVLDIYLKDSAPRDQVDAVLNLACSCVSRAPNDRPSMDKIVERLELVQSWAVESLPKDVCVERL